LARAIQIFVDDAHQLIVAAALSNQAPDAEYFEPLLRRAIDNCNAVPAVITADAGYFSGENVAAAEHLGSEPLIAVGSYASNGLLCALAYQGCAVGERDGDQLSAVRVRMIVMRSCESCSLTSPSGCLYRSRRSA